LDAVPLGGFRNALALTAQFGDGRDLLRREADSLVAQEMRGTDAVQQQVRIAADGGGEMRVVRRSQPEVAVALLAVGRLPPGAQPGRRRQLRLRPALPPFDQARTPSRCRAAVALQPPPEAADELAQLLDARGVGRVMDAVRDRQLLPRRVARDRL